MSNIVISEYLSLTCPWSLFHLYGSDINYLTISEWVTPIQTRDLWGSLGSATGGVKLKREVLELVQEYHLQPLFNRTRKSSYSSVLSKNFIWSRETKIILKITNGNPSWSNSLGVFYHTIISDWLASLSFMGRGRLRSEGTLSSFYGFR